MSDDEMVEQLDVEQAAGRQRLQTLQAGGSHASPYPGQVLGLGHEVPRMKSLGSLALVGLLLVACSARLQPGANASSSAGTPSSAPDASPVGHPAPVDSSLPAESRSALSDGAVAALTACGLLERLDLVSGIAPIPHAADAVKYANIWGQDPYLNDKAAWLITTKGEFFVRTQKGIDPTCLVIDREATWLMTSGYIQDGKRVEALVRTDPKLRIPALTP